MVGLALSCGAFSEDETSQGWTVERGVRYSYGEEYYPVAAVRYVNAIVKFSNGAYFEPQDLPAGQDRGEVFISQADTFRFLPYFTVDFGEAFEPAEDSFIYVTDETLKGRLRIILSDDREGYENLTACLEVFDNPIFIRKSSDGKEYLLYLTNHDINAFKEMISDFERYNNKYE